MGPTEPPSSTQNYHAALREIIDSARKPDQLRRVVKNRRINSFSSLPLDSAASDWRGDALARLRLTRSVITEEPINALQQIQFIGGGGGGGGGTFVFKVSSWCFLTFSTFKVRRSFCPELLVFELSCVTSIVVFNIIYKN